MKHRIAVFGLILVAIGAVLLLGRHLLTTSESTLIKVEHVAKPVAAAPAERAEPTPVVEATTPSTTPNATAGAPGGTFRGRVIDAATRQPLVKFEVTLVGVPKGHVIGNEPRVAKTFESANGRFAWEQAPVGNWNVTVAAPRYQHFRLDGLSIAVGKTTREVVMPLQSGHVLKGRVFDQVSGAGIADAHISFRDPAQAQPNWMRHRYVKSKKDGAFELDGVPGGEVIVIVGAHLYAPRELTVIVTDDMPSTEIGLSSGGKVSGMVVTPDGMPAKGHVMLAGPGIAHGSELDESGGFTFTNRPAGSYRLSANTSAGAARLEFELAENEVREDIVLKVGEGRSVRGVIKGLRAEQLESAFIGVWPESTRSQISGRPDGQGAYIVNGVPPGRAQVTLDAGMSHSFNKTIDVPADKDAVLDIVFPPGVRLSGRITQAAKPIAPTTVWVGSVDGKGQMGYRARTAADGRYEIQGVPPGEYRIGVHEGTSRIVTIASDTVVDIDMPLVELGGRIVEHGGTTPIVGVGVHVIGIEPSTALVGRYKESDDFGQFQLIGLEPGELLLSVYKPGYEMHREKISYSSPITNKAISLRKSAGVKVNVRRVSFAGPLERFYLRETLPNIDRGIGLWVAVDRDGVGYLPSELAGSSLKITFSGAPPVVIEKWNGQSLELKL
jgi:hypothetical protein